MTPSAERASPDRAERLGRWVRAFTELTDLLAVARGLAEVAPDVLRVAARLGDFERVALWSRGGDRDEWTRTRVWVRNAAASAAREETRGSGPIPPLVLRAAADRGPLTSDDGLATAAADGGGPHSLVLPILHGDRCFGVLEMAGPVPFAMLRADADAAASIGRQIGQFVAREEALRESGRTRRELADVFENAPVGLHLMDGEGRILRVNRAELEILGYPRDEIVGRRWRDFHDEPDVADRLLARLAAEPAPDGVGAPVGGEEVRLRRQDGGLRWVRVEANALRDEGRVVHVRTFVQDVTATRAAELALKASEERHRRLVEGARDYALHGLDVHGRVTTWNVGAERLFGYVEADVLGRDFSSSMTPEDRADGVAARILELAADEGEFRHEGWRVRKDGSRFWAEVVYSAIRDEAGGLVGISQLSRDVTERRGLDALRRKSAELVASNREVLESALRNAALLTSVAAAIDGPAAEIQDAAAGVRSGDRDAITRLEGAVGRLGEAVEGLQGLASKAPPDRPASPSPIDLARAATEVRDMLGEPAAGRRIRVDVDVSPAIDDVVADPVRLRQVLYNLLANAIRSSRDRGRVVLRIVEEGKASYRVEVHDSGAGLSAEAIASAFSAGTEEDVGEAELGLAATRRIVEGQGGRVGVQSAAGHGSVFSAVLPRRPVEGERDVRPAGAVGASPARVLVVAEDASTRAGLSWALGHASFDVATANGVDEGVRAVNDERFDAVAVDLLLPRAGAVEFVATLRRAGASRGTPWVLVAMGTAAAGVGCCAVSDLLPSPTPADRMFAALERTRVPRGVGRTIVVGDADAKSCEATMRTLRLLGYHARGHADGDACLRACAEHTPSAIVLAPRLEGMGVLTFARHVRAAPGLDAVPLFLTLPHELDAVALDALQRDALLAVGDRSWERCLRHRSPE